MDDDHHPPATRRRENSYGGILKKYRVPSSDVTTTYYDDEEDDDVSDRYGREVSDASSDSSVTDNSSDATSASAVLSSDVTKTLLTRNSSSTNGSKKVTWSLTDEDVAEKSNVDTLPSKRLENTYGDNSEESNSIPGAIICAASSCESSNAHVLTESSESNQNEETTSTSTRKLLRLLSMVAFAAGTIAVSLFLTMGLKLMFNGRRQHDAINVSSSSETNDRPALTWVNDSSPVIKDVTMPISPPGTVAAGAAITTSAPSLSMFTPSPSPPTPHRPTTTTTSPPRHATSAAPTTGIPGYQFPPRDADEMRAIVDILSSSVTTDLAILSDGQSAQSRAMAWILTGDASRLGANSSNLIQRYVLATFYYSAGVEAWEVCFDDNARELASCDDDDDDDAYRRFLSGANECQWFGIHCGSQGRVRRILLDKNGLRGTIPSEISQLDHVIEIDLSHNSLKGSLPTLLPPKIHSFIVDNNEFGGSIPSRLGDLIKLRHYSIGNNRMTGRLPSDMFPPSLETLDLGGNFFTSTVPDTLFNNSKALVNVDLGINEFTGTISPHWGSLEKLRVLKLQINQFSGTLSGDIFNSSSAAAGGSSSLHTLSLGTNELTGTIPDELFRSKLLEYLDLGGNRFEGTISSRFGELSHMKHLILWQNRLTGEIPEDIGNLTLLEMFQVPYNYLRGEIPRQICARTPKPLVSLSADCSSSQNHRSRVHCDCCVSCYEGYS